MGLIAALVVASVIPLWPLISGKCMVFMLDALHQHLAWQVSLGHVLVLAASSVPGWNPFMFGGCPLLADPQMQVAYPPALLYRFLPLAIANGTFLSLHLVLATVGTGLFLRGRKLSPVACFGGAVSFGLGMHAVLLMACAPVLCAFAWLPWACLCADRLAQRPSATAGGAWAVVVTWMALAGSPQYVLYAVIAATIMVLADSFMSVRRVGALWGATAVGLAAAAIMLVPFFRYLPETSRAAPLAPPALAEDAAVVRDLLSYVAPDLAVPQEMAASPVARDRWVRIHFGGILLLPLACVGLCSRRRGQDRSGAAALVAAGILLAVAPGTAWGGWLGSVPPFGYMRRAALWLGLADFGFAWLAALGLDRLSEDDGSMPWILIPAAGVAAACSVYVVGWSARGVGWFVAAVAVTAMGRRRWISGRLGAGMLALFMYMDVWSYGGRVHWTAPAEWLTGSSPEEVYLLRNAGEVSRIRCASWPPGRIPGTRRIRTVTGGTLEETIRKIRPGLDPNLQALSGLRSADGDNPLVPAVRWWALDRLGRDWAANREGVGRVLAGLGVTHAIAAPFMARFLPPPGSRRVFSETAYILRLPEAGGPRLAPRGAGRITSARSAHPGFWEVTCELETPATLVIPETGLPGWQAVVDGRVVATAVDAFGNLVVALGPNRHRVAARYEPPGFGMGLVLSLVMLGLLLVAALRPSRSGLPAKRLSQSTTHRNVRAIGGRRR